MDLDADVLVRLSRWNVWLLGPSPLTSAFGADIELVRTPLRVPSCISQSSLVE